jgi:hypothetical protein
LRRGDDVLEEKRVGSRIEGPGTRVAIYLIMLRGGKVIARVVSGWLVED